MQIDIQVSNKQLLGLALVLVIVAAIGYVQSYGTADPTSVGHTWNEIGNIPWGFADNIDNDLLSTKNCPEGTVLKYQSPGQWDCWNDFVQPKGVVLYILHSECDMAYDGVNDRDLVLEPTCTYETWTTATPRCRCRLLSSQDKRNPECAGTGSTCSNVRTYYKFECDNAPMGYLVDLYGWVS